MTVNKQTATAFNAGQISPGQRFPPRARQTYDAVIAQPARSRTTGHRSGPRQAEERLGYLPEVSGSFVGGIVNSEGDEPVYERQIAPNARGRLASGKQIPAW